MEISVITACMFKTPEPIHILQASCDRWGIELKPYGLGTTYTDWPDIKITKMLAKFEEEEACGATHILYTDGRDSFFLTALGEVMDKYARMGSPEILMAAETGCYPREWLADKFPDPGHHYRWPGSGQFMGRVEALIRDWTWLKEKFMRAEEDANEQGWMVQALADRDLDWELDTRCEIFQSAGNGDTGQVNYGDGSDGGGVAGGELEIRETPEEERRVYNTVTGSWPCVLHFNGGYSDPFLGKEVVGRVWGQVNR